MEIRRRVVIASGLLVSAKLLNISVPFLFKYAVDYLNTALDSPLVLNGEPQMAVFATTSAILIGCKFVSACHLHIYFCLSYIYFHIKTVLRVVVHLVLMSCVTRFLPKFPVIQLEQLVKMCFFICTTSTSPSI